MEYVFTFVEGIASFISPCILPLLPVYIKKNPRIFSKVYVVFGKPIKLPEDVHKDKEKMQEYSDMLLDEIYKLKDEIPIKKNKKK